MEGCLSEYISSLKKAIENDDKELGEKTLSELRKLGVDCNTAYTLVWELMKEEFKNAGTIKTNA